MNILKLQHTYLLKIEPDYFLDDETLIDLELQYPGKLSIIYDLTQYKKGNMTFDIANNNELGNHHIMHWDNPIWNVVLGIHNRYFIVNGKQYYFTPRSVVDVSDARVSLRGKFLNPSTALNYLKECEELPSYTLGKLKRKWAHKVLDYKQTQNVLQFLTF